MTKFKIAIVLFLLLIGQGLSSPASAETYLNRPVRILVPWPPGGGTDAVARILAQRASEGLGQQVFIENKGGASTLIGMAAVAKSIPDGFTFGMPTQSFAVNATLQPNVPYDTVKDFDPVILLGTGTYVLVVNSAVPAKTLDELINLIKAHPEKYNAGFTGFGSPSHLGLVQFERMTGAKPAEVNYKGTGPAVTDLIAGQTQLMFTTLAGVLPNVRGGNLRVIAVTSRTRSELLPDVPTAIESGLPGFVVFEWYGLNAPKGTPKEAITRMNAEMRRVLALPDVREHMKLIGAEASNGSTPEEFGAFVSAEIAKWGKIVREANIKPQ